MELKLGPNLSMTLYLDPWGHNTDSVWFVEGFHVQQQRSVCDTQD